MKALITGATGGFGRVLSGVMAMGYDIWLHGRDAMKLNSIKNELEEEFMDTVRVICGDLIHGSTKKLLVDCVDKNDIDVFINNAAVNGEIVETMAVNATATMLLIDMLITLGKPLTIVNINSVAGLRGSPNEPAYSASKFALRGYSESVKFQAIKKGIRIIDVYIGAMSVGMAAGRGTINPVEAAELIVDVIESKSFIPELKLFRE